MKTALLLLIGFIVGSMVGVCTMCVFQINRK